LKFRLNIYEYLYEEVEVEKNLLEEAFTHPSYKSIDESEPSFERLEFVGDSVLDLIIAEWLYNHINEREGVLTQIRSTLVKTATLVETGEKLGLAEYMRTSPEYKIIKSDLEDCLEAIIGSIYLSKGMDKAREFILLIFKQRLDEILEKTKTKEGLESLLTQAVCEKNPINALQEFCQKRKIELPKFILIEKRGEEHNPEYEIECQLKVNGLDIITRGIAEKKKKARKIAAEKAINKIAEFFMDNNI